MATEKTTTPAADDIARGQIACDAAGEIEALVGMLRREIDNDCDQLLTIVQSTLRRIKDLNSVVLSVLADDANRDSDEMCEVVYWRPMPAAE